MIDPKTLMIGNYLTFLGETVEVAGIHNLKERPEMYWISMKDAIDAKMIHFKPIPLTEQWLLDFGFEYWGKVYVSGDFDTFKRYVLYNVDNETSYFEVRIINNEHNNNTACKIAFLGENEEEQNIKETAFIHNLQQVYFQVTGNHLKLKK